MFGIDLISLAVGIALGATFPAFFNKLWTQFKMTQAYAKIIAFFSKKA